jgi:hypothetical protein
MLLVASVPGLAAIAAADTIQGSYVEARSVPAPSSTDADPRGGQPSRAVLAWQIRQGEYDGERLDGQTIVAIVTPEPSPGSALGRTMTVFVVDSRATAAQERALVHLAKDLAPAAIRDGGEVARCKLDVRIAEGCGCGVAVVDCHLAKFRTRRLTDADQAFVAQTQHEKPLGDVFSSNQAAAEQCSLGQQTADDAGHIVLAFTGSFSK